MRRDGEYELEILISATAGNFINESAVFFHHESAYVTIGVLERLTLLILNKGLALTFQNKKYSFVIAEVRSSG